MAKYKETSSRCFDREEKNGFMTCDGNCAVTRVAYTCPARSRQSIPSRRQALMAEYMA